MHHICSTHKLTKKQAPKKSMDDKAINHTQQYTNRKLILFPIPLQGHVTPMLHLANLLHSKSFSITIVQTCYNSIDSTLFPHFTFHLLEDIVPKNSQVSSDNLATALSEIQEICEEPFRACLARILSEMEPFCCLISDSLWAFAGGVAENLNIPRIVLRTSSMSAFVVNDCIPVLREKGYFLTGANPEEPVEDIPPFKVKDLPGDEHHDILASVVQQTKTSHGVICNTFEELEGSSIAKVRQNLSIPIFPIGPLHKYFPTLTTSIWTQDQTSIPWLNKQAPNSVLYVSFGSIADISISEFLEIAWALANSKQPFLWVVRDAGDLLPEGYLETVKEIGHIVKWATQVEVLAHPSVGGFWTHCGWNSTIEAVVEGVPMICLPFFVDQGMNARYVSDVWRIGVRLEKGMRRDDIEKVIRNLMEGVEGEEMRSRARALKECATHCLMDDGSSSRAIEKLTSYLLSI